MNKYTNLSDFEINKKVAINVGGFALSLMVFDDRNGVVKKNIQNIGSRVFTEFNPCNNPVDAMPIIIENRIAIFPMGTLGVEYWCAASDFEDIGEKEIIWGMEANNKNPLRAAMETYLLMKGAENEINNKR
ncbi:phage protein NinX family protein [Providencia alcalifaciens]|uniref:phage protein NinX family protein n=1 Tax=Providencia alcalifaciens TaxID=126385 RepID=UPI00029BD65E|nr:phage recombination protein [Providencia alcalifaciens Dmel2]